MTQLQAQQLLAAGAGGQVNQQVFAPQAAIAAAAPSLGATAPAPNAAGNAGVINHLVASLQAQQQAQQQVQVQAAIARAFGPGGGGGLSAAGFNNNPMVNLAGMTSSISQPSARDILSRMQLVQDNAAAAGNKNTNDDLVKLQQAQQSGELVYCVITIPISLHYFIPVSHMCNFHSSSLFINFQLHSMINSMDSRLLVSSINKFLPSRIMLSQDSTILLDHHLMVP